MIGTRYLILTFLTVVHAKPVMIHRDLVIHEKRDEVPSGFSIHGPANGDTTLHLRLALAQGNMIGLEKALYEISSPSSDRYGKHLSQDEVAAYVRPPADTASKVDDWLSSHNLSATSTSYAGDWLDVSIPVSKANELLGADFNVFGHRQSGQQTIRTLSYSIPATLQGHLNLVHPTVK